MFNSLSISTNDFSFKKQEIVERLKESFSLNPVSKTSLDWANEYELHELIAEQARVNVKLIKLFGSLSIVQGNDLDWDELRTLRDQYEAAMSRQSSYLCRDLADHAANYAFVFKYEHKNGTASYLVGNVLRDVFIVSHFAPASLKGGVEMMRWINEKASFNVAFAIPFRLAKMACKLKFDYICTSHQLFAGHCVIKHVFCNHYLDKKHKLLLKKISKYFGEKVQPLPLP